MKKISFIIGILIMYQLYIMVGDTRGYFPSLSQLAHTVVTVMTSSDIYIHMGASIVRVAVGFFLAGIVGIALGLLLASNSRFSELKTGIELLRPIPPIAWIPIAIILFGLGNASAYFIVFLGAFFPIFTNTYFGASSLPLVYKRVALSFEVPVITYIMKILVPYTLPYIFTGLKIGIGMAWMSVIASELIAAQSGLGYYIQMNRIMLQTDNIMIGMILIGLIGTLIQKLIEYMEKRIIVWS